MPVAGDAALWSELFPYDLLPEILDLVTETWETFSKPDGNELEEVTTRRFRIALVSANQLKRLPLRIDREVWIDDPLTANPVGRLDIRLTHGWHVDAYFTFECKRLSVRYDGKWRSFAMDYVKDGILRFVTGQYAARQRAGGMIGYVMDGQLAKAIQAVDAAIRSYSTDLRMSPPAGLQDSALRPHQANIRETMHHLPPRDFVLHHIFLVV